MVRVCAECRQRRAAVRGAGQDSFARSVAFTWDLVREDDAMPETGLLLGSAWKAAIAQESLSQSSEGPYVVEWLRSWARARPLGRLSLSLIYPG